VVTVNDLPPGGGVQTRQFSVPGNGFVMSDGRGFLAFSAIPPGGATRIDYVRSPGRWEALTSRGTAQSFGGFPSAALLTALGAHAAEYQQGTIIRNDVHNLVVGAAGGLWNPASSRWTGSGRVEAFTLGAEPVANALTLTVQRPTVRVHEQVGLSSQVAFGNGARRIVTPLTAFTALPAGLVSVDQNGALTALAPGEVTVTASYDADGPGGQGPLSSTPVVVHVVP
jgi:hypothetical protein